MSSERRSDRRHAIIRLTHEDIANMIELSPELEVLALFANTPTASVDVLVAGEHLDIVAPGAETPMLDRAASKTLLARLFQP